MPVRGHGPAGGLDQGDGLEGELGDDPFDAGHGADRVHGGGGEPGPLGDGLGLVLGLGPSALFLLDRGLVDVLVGGNQDRRGRVALGVDLSAESRFQERPAGGDEGGRAEQCDEGAEEAGLAVSDGLKGVTQHHAANSAAVPGA